MRKTTQTQTRIRVSEMKEIQIEKDIKLGHKMLLANYGGDSERMAAALEMGKERMMQNIKQQLQQHG